MAKDADELERAMREFAKDHDSTYWGGILKACVIVALMDLREAAQALEKVDCDG